MMTQGTRKQTTEPVLGTPILGMSILGTNKLQPLTAVSHAFLFYLRFSEFLSVDLIGENNHVILELFIINKDSMGQY